MGKYPRTREHYRKPYHLGDPDNPYIKCDHCGGEFWDYWIEEFPEHEINLCRDCAARFREKMEDDHECS